MSKTQKSNNTDKKKKTAVIVAGVASAIIILLIAGAVAVSVIVKNDSSQIYQKALIALMPEKLDDNNLTFYVKENKNAAVDENNAYSGFTFYYYDENGKEVELDRYGVYYDPETKEATEVGFSFVAKAAMNLREIQKVLYIIAAVFAAVVLCVILYFWYKSCERYDDAEKRKKQISNGSKKN